jgi:hypothetical protein
MKNDALGASGGLWSNTWLQECDFGAPRKPGWSVLGGKVKFWVDKGAHLGG